MKKPSLQEIVLRHTLPNPKGNDPTTFFGHVQRNLVPEVRHEVQVFYGSLDCLEAQYPGLDYTYAPHRRRLGRYTWHKRLFKTFDELSLTHHEILSLCQWEGTRSAKERYEAETKRKIRDTTADDIAPAAASAGPRARHFNWQEYDDCLLPDIRAQSATFDSTESEAEQSDEDELASSIGVQLNQQLQAAVEARSRGEDASVDPQWEQWMKEALERNDFSGDSIVQAVREGRLLSRMSADSGSAHPRYPAPDSTLESLTTPPNVDGPLASGLHPSIVNPQISRRYDDLRSMLSELQTANNQLAADNAQLAMLLSRNQPETAR